MSMNQPKSMWFIIRIISLLMSFIKNPDNSARGKLYLAAVTKLGEDASPYDRVPDDLACVESLTSIIII